MELDETILRIKETGDNFSDVTFVAPFSVDEIDNESPKQLRKLLQELSKNIWGYDLMLCFFIAALKSYRADRCLRPFPSLYVNEEGKNFNLLRKTCDCIPPLTDILSEPNKCSHEVANLLNWLFLYRGCPVLKRTSFNHVPFPSKISDVFKPHYVFEVCYQDKVEALWRRRVNGRQTIFAYHGSAVDNFYSILKVGLQQHFSFEKEVLFGNGIYLSTEISVSAHYAPFGQTWFNSALGKKHSVIAICEIINDIDKVKCKDATNKGRSINKNSLGKIPEKYFVVTDSDMVRVKYLMVYKEKTVFSVKSYIARHFFFSLLILYLLLMIGIGLFGNSAYMKQLRRLCHILFFD